MISFITDDEIVRRLRRIAREMRQPAATLDSGARWAPELDEIADILDPPEGEQP